MVDKGEYFGDIFHAIHNPFVTGCCRQIHPLYGEKAGLLGYYDAVGNTENFPPAPNIVVEGGRIEFVRPSQDVTTTNTMTNSTTTRKNNTMSRGSQTFSEQTEKSDPAKVSQFIFTNSLEII